MSSEDVVDMIEEKPDLGMLELQMFSEFNFDELDRLEWYLKKDGSKKLLGRAFSDMNPILCTQKLVKFFTEISEQPTPKFPSDDTGLMMQCAATISSHLNLIRNPLEHILNEEMELKSEEELTAELLALNKAEGEVIKPKKCGGAKNGNRVHALAQKSQAFCMTELLPLIRPDLFEEPKIEPIEEPVEEDEAEIGPSRKRGKYNKRIDPLYLPKARNPINPSLSVSSRGRICKRISTESLDYDPSNRVNPKKMKKTKSNRSQLSESLGEDLNSSAISVNRMSTSQPVFASNAKPICINLDDENNLPWLKDSYNEPKVKVEPEFMTPSESSLDSGVGISPPPENAEKQDKIAELLRRQGYVSFL